MSVSLFSNHIHKNPIYKQNNRCMKTLMYFLIYRCHFTMHYIKKNLYVFFFNVHHYLKACGLGRRDSSLPSVKNLISLSLLATRKWTDNTANDTAKNVPEQKTVPYYKFALRNLKERSSSRGYRILHPYSGTIMINKNLIA